MTSITGTPSIRQPVRQETGGASETEKAFLDFRSVMAEQYQQWRALPEEQKHRHIYLDKHGMSESDLDLLPAQDRLMHEQKIAEVANQPFAPLGSPSDRMKTDKAWTSAVVTLQSVLQSIDPAEVDHGEEVSEAATPSPFAALVER
ncbi:MAG: hypothetical protein Tsb0019_19750 [Roseibium sp.]